MDKEKIIEAVEKHNKLLEQADEIFYYDLRQKLEEKHGEKEVSAILDDIQEYNCCFFIDIEQLKKYL